MRLSYEHLAHLRQFFSSSPDRRGLALRQAAASKLAGREPRDR